MHGPVGLFCGNANPLPVPRPLLVPVLPPVALVLPPDPVFPPLPPLEPQAASAIAAGRQIDAKR